MKTEYTFKIKSLAIGLLFLAVAGCDQRPPSGSLVLTEAPASGAINVATDMLDARYPIGSRVVLREPPFDSRHEKVLSGNLVAAGGPVVSYDRRRVFFVGKATAAGDWQIYESLLASWGPHIVTAMPGGAMSPTLLPNGNLAFISPVPNVNPTKANQSLSAIWMQAPGGQRNQLTFIPSPIIDSTVLSDGRILFAAMQNSSSNTPPQCALYTINNDGTEITEFAEQEIPVSLMQKPRQTLDGRVVFVVSRANEGSRAGQAEFVRMARPCLNGSRLLSNVTARVSSVESGGNQDFIVCAAGLPGNSTLPAVFRLSSTAATLDSPLVAEPARGFPEAIEVAARRPPMGRLSTVDFNKHTGKILCLDVNFTRAAADGTRPSPAAARVRVTAEISPGIIRRLGEVPVQADGSFLAEVPANVPLGFEVLEESGRMVERQSPLIWVRPGENRSCIGCHEPSHRAPHNHRPLAVSVPVPSLNFETAKLATDNF